MYPTPTHTKRRRRGDRWSDERGLRAGPGEQSPEPDRPSEVRPLSSCPSRELRLPGFYRASTLEMAASCRSRIRRFGWDFGETTKGCWTLFAASSRSCSPLGLGSLPKTWPCGTNSAFSVVRSNVRDSVSAIASSGSGYPRSGQAGNPLSSWSSLQRWSPGTGRDSGCTGAGSRGSTADRRSMPRSAH